MAPHGSHNDPPPGLVSRKKYDGERSSPAGIPAGEVAKHASPSDCWLIIDGGVYDVSAWVPKHPGGAMIYVRAGQDCTELFEAYHPLYVRKMLSKHLIGVVEPTASSGRDGAGLKFGQDGSPDSAFYTVLKQRVEAHFKANKINPQVHAQMFVKAALIILGNVLCFYGAYLAPWGMGYSVLCAAALGVFTAQVGVSIQHDCNHGAFSKTPLLSYVMGLTLDLVGASSFMWKQQHVVGHHLSTNVDHFDPDIRVNDPDVRRVTLQQPLQAYHAYQHLYLLALYGLLALKSVLLDDFSAYFSGTIGPVKLPKMTPGEEAIFWGTKVAYAAYTFGLPALWGNRTLTQFLALYLLCQLVTGWLLAFLFQVAHVVPEAEFPVPFPAPKDGTPSLPRSWAAHQVATSTDFGHNSFFWTHFSGGLNYQIEHHLFPGVCHLHYPGIQPIVEKTCRAFGIPYHCYSSYWEALRAHISHLKHVGISTSLLSNIG